jgi:hypothetical protein
VAGLAKHVAGTDEDAAVQAAQTLGQLGRGAEAALPALRKAATSDSWELKLAAQEAAERIAAGE